MALEFDRFAPAVSVFGAGSGVKVTVLAGASIAGKSISGCVFFI